MFKLFVIDMFTGKIDGMEWENCGDVEDGVLVQVVVAEEMVKKSYEKDSSLDWELTKLFGGEVGGGGRRGGVGGGVCWWCWLMGIRM